MSDKSLFSLYKEHSGKVSDKWELYLSEYDRILSSYRTSEINLLEIGAQNGGSLEIWANYFPNAKNIIGCDINPDCSKLKFGDHRIKLMVGDANDDLCKKQILSYAPKYDIIIDDGSHVSDDIVKSFVHYFPKLAIGGTYIAEDLHCSYWSSHMGGLYDPYSSISFFKLLADIVNQEHWGVNRDAESLLVDFSRHYSISFKGIQFSNIHSVEFVNSICIIRTSESKKNFLGKRFISGQVEDVVNGHLGLMGALSVAPLQTDNIFSNSSPPSREQVTALQSELEGVNSTLCKFVAEVDEHKQEIGKYHNLVLEKNSRIGELQEEISKHNDLVLEKNSRIDLYKNLIDILRAEISANESALNDSASNIEALQLEISKYHHAILERDSEIGKYHNAVMERDRTLGLILNSFSWKATKWMRAIKKGFLHLYRKYQKVKSILFRYWSTENFRKIFNIYRNQGFNGVIKRIKLEIQKNDIKHELEALEFFSNRNSANYFPQILNDKSWEPPPITVDIIIPVYRGLAYTKKCIDSIIATRAKTKFRIIVIDDCSPEPDLVDYLSTLEVADDFIVLSNPKNLGFVGTVNKGMALSGVNDVLLLNSDAEVPNYFLDALVWHAYNSEKKVATVTPFTNNGTICSFPTIHGASKLPLDAELNWINAVFSRVNRHRSVEVPTGVGFCMYIRREALKEVGLFDEEAFGKGYGEENDFCIKASQLGWKNLLAADAFVFHAGEVSFQGDSSPGKIKAMEILRGRYPHYASSVTEHVTKAEADPFRVAAAGGLFIANGRPTVLIIGHALGGGTEKHWLEVVEKTKKDVNFVILKPNINKQNLVSMGLVFDEGIVNTNIAWMSEYNFLLDLIKSFGISRIHVHHLLGIEQLAEKLINDLKMPFDFTLHDYFTICPKVNLMSGGQYCGEIGIKQCNKCIAIDLNISPNEIIAWRNKLAWVVQDAVRVICPSDDSYQRIKRYHPLANAIVVPHEELLPGVVEKNKKKNNVQTINIVVLGVLAEHKGLKVVSDILSLMKGSNLRINLIGSSNGVLSNSDYYSESGSYLDHELPQLLESHSPDLIWFPAVWPETYSYTLSAAIKGGYRVLAPNLGAFKERLEDYHSGKIYQHNIDSYTLIKIIKEFCKVV